MRPTENHDQEIHAQVQRERAGLHCRLGKKEWARVDTDVVVGRRAQCAEATQRGI